MKEILKIKNISKDYGIKGFKTNVLKIYLLQSMKVILYQ